MSQSHKTDHKSQAKRIEAQNHVVIKNCYRNELKTERSCFKSQEKQTHVLISTLGPSSIKNMLAQNHICTSHSLLSEEIGVEINLTPHSNHISAKQHKAFSLAINQKGDLKMAKIQLQLNFTRINRTHKEGSGYQREL